MIAIIDYGAGNLRSVEKALTAIGEEEDLAIFVNYTSLNRIFALNIEV